MIRKLVNTFDKEEVYNLYEMFVAEPKDYQKITRYQMIQALQKAFIDDDELALNFIPLSTLKRLEIVANETHDYVLIDDAYFGYEPKLLDMIYLENIHTDAHDNIYYKLDPYFKKVFQREAKDEALLEKKEYETIILGILEVYGNIFFEDVVDMLSDIYETPVDFDLDFFESQYFIDYLLYQGYSMNRTAIYHPANQNFYDETPRVVYEKKLYFEYGLYGVPLEIKQNSAEIGAFENIDYHAMASIYHDLIQTYQEPYLFFATLLKEEPSFHTELLVNWPIWKWGGMNFLVYNETQMVEVLQEPKDYLTYLTQFTDVALRLQGIDAEAENFDDQDIYDALKKTLNHKDSFELAFETLKDIDSQDKEEILTAFENIQILDDGIALNIEDGQLAVYSDHRIYYLRSPALLFDDFMDPKKLPYKVELILIPFKDNLTYFFDILQFESVEADADFLNKIKTAKHVYQISDMSYGAYH